jgi:hypothetical protein
MATPCRRDTRTTLLAATGNFIGSATSNPDWLLLNKIDGNGLHLVRTLTHSDLFKVGQDLGQLALTAVPTARDSL